jgi:hypothetical protein
VAVLDAAHPGFARFADLCDALRATNARVASLLERCGLVESTDAGLVIGLDTRSFEAGFLNDPAVRALIAATAKARLGASATVEFVDADVGPNVPTLAKMVGDAVKKRKDALEKNVRSHPLVLAAMTELKAEIRDVRLSAEAENAPVSLKEARDRAE